MCFCTCAIHVLIDDDFVPLPMEGPLFVPNETRILYNCFSSSSYSFFVLFPSLSLILHSITHFSKVCVRFFMLRIWFSRLFSCKINTKASTLLHGAYVKNEQKISVRMFQSSFGNAIPWSAISFFFLLSFLSHHFFFFSNIEVERIAEICQLWWRGYWVFVFIAYHPV